MTKFTFDLSVTLCRLVGIQMQRRGTAWNCLYVFGFTQDITTDVLWNESLLAANGRDSSVPHESLLAEPG